MGDCSGHNGVRDGEKGRKVKGGCDCSISDFVVRSRRRKTRLALVSWARGGV